MRIALIGSRGMLARKVTELAGADHHLHAFSRPGFDISAGRQVRGQLTRLAPDVIINCAAFTDVDGAETQEELAHRVNGAGPGHLADAARALDATLVHISSDYVFDGRKSEPYLETDPVAPLSAYGRSKLAGEQAVLGAGLARFYIVRTSWLYGPGGRNFVETILRLARQQASLRVVDDQVGTPTYTGDLAAAILALIALPHHAAPAGIYHFCNAGECSWHGFATAIVSGARALGERLSCEAIEPIPTTAYPTPALRPLNSRLDISKYQRATGRAVPPWQTSLAAYLRERRAAN
jgi:dTDP-4-dehydrorhamnose reductase